MKTLSKFGLAVAGAAAMGSVATVFDSGEAYAATLNGSISFGGFLTGVNTGVNPTSDTFNFGAPSGSTGTGDFSGVTISSLVSSLKIDFLSALPSSGTTTSGLYSFGAIPNLFTLSNGFTFALDPGTLTRDRTKFGNLVSVGGFGFLTGKFFNTSGEVSGLGSLSFTGATGGSGTYGVTITTEEIPTPVLLPGLLGLGVAALRRKQEEDELADS